MNAPVVLRSKRRAVARNGPLDKDRAYCLLFREKMIAAVWFWLDRLAVPIRDRRDLIQEVFLQAHRSFHTYDPMRGRPERWLNKITVHAASHYRDRAHHRREELQPEPLLDAVDSTPPAPEQIQAEQDRLLLWELLSTIEPDLRSVLVAHDIDGIPIAEIAEQRGIPLSTAYKWRARALAALRAAAHQRTEEEAAAGRVP